MRYTAFKKLLLLLCFLLPVIVMAQPAGGGPAGGAEPVPVTGLEFLLVSGGILGGYRYLKNRNNQKVKT